MKRKALVLLLIFLLSAFLVPSIPFPKEIKQILPTIQKSFAVDATQVNTTTINSGIKDTRQNLACVYNGYNILFYWTGTTYWYSYSPAPGTSWTSGGAQTWMTTNTQETVSIYCDSSGDIFASSYDGAGDGIFQYRQGTISSGVITWSFAAISLNTGIAGAFIRPNSVYGFDASHVWITVSDDQTHSQVWNCHTSSCGSTGNWANTKSFSETDSAVVGLGNSTSAAVIIGSTFNANHIIAEISSINSGSSWGSPVNTTGAYTLDYGSWMNVGATVYAAVPISATQNVYFLKFASGAWTETNVCTCNLQSNMGMSTDGAGHFIIAGTANNTQIDFLNSTNSGVSWGNQIKLNTSSNIINSGGRFQAFGFLNGKPSFAWMQGAGSPFSIFFLQTPAAFTVTESLTCKLKGNGGTTETISFSGGSVSPTTGFCSSGGSLSTLTINPSVTLTITVAADSASIRYRGNSSWSGGTSYGLSVGGTSQANTIYNYQQNHSTFQYAVIGSSSGSTAPNLALTYTGASNSTTLTTSPQGIWADIGKAWNTTNPLTGSGGSERWIANSSSGTIGNAGVANTITYNQQWFLTITSTPAGTTNGTSEFINNGNSLRLLATPSGVFTFASWSCSGSGCYSGISNPSGSFTMNNAITETPHFSSSTFSNNITIQWYIAGNISVTINMVRQNLGAALNSSNYILASYTQAGNSMTANLVDGTNTIIVDNNTLVTINSNSSLSAGGAEQWCLDNCIPNSFTPNHNQTVTEDYWIQDFVSYRWVPPVACSFVCTLVHPIVVSTGFSDLQSTQLSDSDGTTVPTSFVSAWIDNNTKWNSSNPFVYDLQNWIPNNTGTTINFGPQLVTLAYTGGGTNSSCTSQNTFLDLLTGCWTGTFVYTWTPILGQFGMGAIFMFIDVALYLKTENPMVALLLMAAEGAGIGFLLPAFFAPLTAIFLAVGITGSLFNLIRNR